MDKLSCYSHLHRWAFLIAFLCIVSSRANAQFYALKVDVLGLCTTSLSVEGSMVVHDQWSLHLPLKVNPWKFNDRPYQQVTTMPGARYWFIDAYSRGWFLGVNAVVSMYNHRGLVGNHMDYFARDYHYKGFGYGAGVSGGYSFPIGKRWNFEVEFGIAGMYLDHDIYDDVNERGRIGYQTGFQPVPGKIAASIVYLF